MKTVHATDTEVRHCEGVARGNPAVFYALNNNKLDCPRNDELLLHNKLWVMIWSYIDEFDLHR